MGYNLYIGELIIETVVEKGTHVYTWYSVVEEVDEKNAPLNSSDLYSNECWPSYISWSDFCQRADLYSLFLDKGEGILYQHPGAYVLTEDVLTEFEEARLRYKDCGDPEIDIYDRRRLDWLCYWTKWALENCKVPVFVNS